MDTLALALTTFTLGLRHGLDFDHVAAIFDISASSAGEPLAASAASGLVLDGRRPSGVVSKFRLCCSYAAGHASIVFVLGVCASVFALVLPPWIEPIMQRVVGVTLLLFGGYVLWSLQARGAQCIPPTRGKLMLSLVAKVCKVQADSAALSTYGIRSTFALGILHGIGAETATQVLLLAAIAGADRQLAGVCLLLFFIAGMLISNTAVSAIASFGTQSVFSTRTAMLVAGLVTALFSIAVGVSFCLGLAS